MPFMDDLNRMRMSGIYGSPSSISGNSSMNPGLGANPFVPPNYDPTEQALHFIDQMRLRNFQDTALTPEQMAGASPLSISRGLSQETGQTTKPMNLIESDLEAY